MINLPDETKRTTIVGRTGSGKTWFGVWLLSMQNFLSMPWVILDFKRDNLLNSLGAQEITLQEIPIDAGLYIARVMPHDVEAVDNFLNEVWKVGRIGLFIDEAMSPAIVKSSAYGVVMTQGRALRIPVINCTQRPAWLNNVTLSESDYFAAFALNRKDDRKRISEFAGDEDYGDIFKNLNQYHCRWVDVSSNTISTIKPVPEKQLLIKSFADKLIIQEETDDVLVDSEKEKVTVL